MAVSEVIITIVTTDIEFYKLIYGELAKQTTNQITNVTNLLGIERQLTKGKTNIIVLDVDKGQFSMQYLKMLVEKYRLLIILTASSTTPALPLMSENVKDFIIKPRNNVFIYTYANSLLKRIAAFIEQTPQLNYFEAQKIVSLNQKIVVIGSSTGGTEALEKILKVFPYDFAPILIVQHITSGFTKFFADRLNSVCKMNIKEASNNDYVQKGVVLIAPADYHMTVVKRESKLMVECFKGAKVNCVMPAADVLFESVANVVKSNAVGVILTGMGSDGAKGLLKMRNAGAETIGQDKESSVVYGMPKVAYDIGAVSKVLPLDKIANGIIEAVAR